MRVQVDYTDNGEETPKTLILYKTELRDQLEIFELPAEPNGEWVNYTHLVAPVRTYLGYCQEDDDSAVAASLSRTGELRWFSYRVADKGHLDNDAFFYPKSDFNPGADVINNFDLFYKGDDDSNDTRRVEPSAVPLIDASWVPTTDRHINHDGKVRTVAAYWVIMQNEWEAVKRLYSEKDDDWIRTEIIERIFNLQNEFAPVLRRDVFHYVYVKKIFFLPTEQWNWYTFKNEITKWIEPSKYWDEFNQFFYTSTMNSAGLCGLHHFKNRFTEASTVTLRVCNQLWLHEYGHSMGSYDCPQGCPLDEGRTFMNGNHVTRFAHLDLVQIDQCFNVHLVNTTTGRDAWSNMKDELDESRFPYRASPPYARQDIIERRPNSTTLIDFLGNDFDADLDDIALHSFRLPSCIGCRLVPLWVKNAEHYSVQRSENGLKHMTVKLVDEERVSEVIDVTMHNDVTDRITRDHLLWRSSERVGLERLWYDIVDSTGRRARGQLLIKTMEQGKQHVYIDGDKVHEISVKGESPVHDVSLNGILISQRAGIEFEWPTPFGQGIKTTNGYLDLSQTRVNDAFTACFWVKQLEAEGPAAMMDYSWYDDRGNKKYMSFKFQNTTHHRYQLNGIVDMPIATELMKWEFQCFTFTGTSFHSRKLNYEDVFGYANSADGTTEAGTGGPADEIPGKEVDCAVLSVVASADNAHNLSPLDQDNSRAMRKDRGAIRLLSNFRGYVDEIRIYDSILSDEEVIQIARYGDGQVQGSVNPIDGALIRSSRVTQPFNEDDDGVRGERITTANGIVLEWPPTAYYGPDGAAASMEYRVYLGPSPDSMNLTATVTTNSYSLKFESLNVAILDRLRDGEETRHCFEPSGYQADWYWCVSDDRTKRDCDNPDDPFTFVYKFTLYNECT
eukprot:GHVN01079000.1.p1 GENE.GHVN01079000.1~~GHVN01079000.1.p1  ORF type:complete len:899 (-),score=128.56 GHVN01079000.1:253-2949(-)